MDFPEEEVQELKTLFGSDIKSTAEGGLPYFLIPKVRIGTKEVDAVLCPRPRDGYPSRLYLAQKIEDGSARNWNGNLLLANRNWFAVSWKLSNEKVRLSQMMALHLRAFQ